MITSDDLALTLISLEGFSLVLYIMASVGRLHGGIIAAVKYFTFGTLGSIFILWGVIQYYAIASSLSIKVISFIWSSVNEISAEVLTSLEWASALILIGLHVKLGTAPTHQWVSDVYSGAPLFVTSFYAVFVKLVLYVLFLRLSFDLSSSFEVEYMAACSLVVGCFGTLRQVEIKRFLAYGSITHMGFLLAGDYVSSAIYLASYILASLVFFSVLLSLRVRGAELTYLSDLRQVSSLGSQQDRLIIVIALSSMAGLPPFAGFYGKMLIWTSLIEDIYLFNDFGSIALLVLNLVVSLAIIFYYMRLIVIVLLGEESDNIVTLSFGSDAAHTSEISASLRVIQYFSSLLLVLWTFIMPSALSVSLAFAESLL